MNSEQSIIINDLLSFISCKIKVAPRDKLLQSLRSYYSEKVILHAQKTLLESLPIKKSTRHGRRVKHPDPLVAMYDCFQLIPSEDLPVFVCRNLNNVPHLESLKEVLKCEVLDDDYLDIDEEMENPHQDIKDEQIVMKSQIADITDVVKQIKDQLKHIVQQQPSPSSPAKQSKSISFSKIGTKRKKVFVSNTNKIASKNLTSILNEPKKSPKKTMAYIQKLIDEDEEMKEETQDEREEDSDYYDEAVSDDERGVVENAVEVVLKEGFEDVLDHSILTTNHRGSPLKMPGEKIIYIKNEEEDFSFDSFDMDEENSIEISSADHYSNFEMDSSSRIFLELCGDGSKNLCEVPKVSSIDCRTVEQSVKRTLVKPKLWCSLCGERFETEINLIEHISYHESGSTLYCSICNFSTTSAKIMRKHLITDHKECFGTESSLSKQYRCFHCKMKSSSKRKMEIHVDTHFDRKNDTCFECEICKKQYLSHASLRKHKRVHAGVKPFKCDICGDTFVYKAYLQSHLKTHGDPKPFACTYCSARFTSKMKVARHERIHTGEKPYQCDECNFKSARSDGLYNHRLSMHSKLKPYECDKCGQCFSVKTKFKQHYQNTHMPGCAFRCRECEKTFKSKATLATHIKFYGHHEDTEYAFSQIWVC